MLRKFLLVLVAVLVASLNALGQETKVDKVGYIYCATGDQYVYLYDSLSTFNVLANLKCGERVDVIGSENGYLMVRTPDEKQGYVPAAGVTSTPSANTPTARASTINRSSEGAPVDTSTSPVGALEPARFGTSAEIFGGYSYVNFDSNGVGSRQNFNGWEGAVAFNAHKWLAVEGSIGGYYKTYSYNLGPLGNLKVKVTDYAFMGGPRINFGRLFVHGLAGLDHLTQSALGSSASENGLAAAIGGGARWRVTPEWSVRASADYLLTRHTGPALPATRVIQNNIRVSGGVVYTFHTRSE